uniref:Proteasome subunit y, putative n=1 Tax=Theileria annulata TaxID=5874 RepID=A0A3B0MTN7_THEAN
MNLQILPHQSINIFNPMNNVNIVDNISGLDKMNMDKMNSLDNLENNVNDINNLENMLNMEKYEDIQMGTTIIGMKFMDGVILVADGRTSSGQIVANRVARKITRILPNIFMLRSGSAADSQTLSTIIRYHAQSLKQQLKPSGRFTTHVRDEMDIDEMNEFDEYKTNEYSIELMNGPLVKSLAKATHNLVHEYRNMLYCGVILAGVDELGSQIYNITLGGTLIEIDDFLATGSGSSFITAFLQDNYKKNSTQEDCLKLLKKSIEYAILNDNSSGGIMRAIIITKYKVKEYYFTLH